MGPTARGQGLISKHAMPWLPDRTGEQCCSVLSLSDPFPVIGQGVDRPKHEPSQLDSSHMFMGRTHAYVWRNVEALVQCCSAQYVSASCLFCYLGMTVLENTCITDMQMQSLMVNSVFLSVRAFITMPVTSDNQVPGQPLHFFPVC